MTLENLRVGGDTYIRLKSNQNGTVFPYTNPHHFRIRFESMIDFTTDDYSVALVDLGCRVNNHTVEKKKDTVVPVLILLDIIQEQYVYGSNKQLLRFTYMRKGKVQYKKFDDVQYIPILPYKTDTMTIHIINADTYEDFSLLTDITRCTLHLRRRRKIS